MKKRKQQRAVGGHRIIGGFLVVLSVYTAINNLYLLKNVSHETIIDYFFPLIFILTPGIFIFFFKRTLNYFIYLFGVLSLFQFSYEIPISEIFIGYSIAVIFFSENNAKIKLSGLSILYILISSIYGRFNNENPTIIFSRIIIAAITFFIIYMNHFKITGHIIVDLSQEEKNLCKMIVDGKPEKAIAADMGVSKSTVTRRISELREKTECETTSDLRVYLIKNIKK